MQSVTDTRSANDRRRDAAHCLASPIASLRRAVAHLTYAEEQPPNNRLHYADRLEEIRRELMEIQERLVEHARNNWD